MSGAFEAPLEVEERVDETRVCLLRDVCVGDRDRDSGRLMKSFPAVLPLWHPPTRILAHEIPF